MFGDLILLFAWIILYIYLIRSIWNMVRRMILGYIMLHTTYVVSMSGHVIYLLYRHLWDWRNIRLLSSVFK